MGGVPAILLVIAAGITYGWQPDREGGVEYIIQVPPNQVERLAQIGEISSVIDPEVRGHVSRVVIRVGTEPLPKDTPANLSGRAAATRALGNADLANLDASPVPIPEMTDGTVAEPIPGFYQGPPAGEQSVLKPDANSPPGSPGYGYPSLPPTLQGTAFQGTAIQGTAPQFDQAGREITSPPASQTNSIFGPSTPNPTAASSSGGTIRIPPPPTRTAVPTTGATPPPFTGSDPQGDYARARAGGPSTDPTNARDNTWRDFPPPPSNTTGGMTTAGSPPENPFQTPSSTSMGIPNANSGYAAGGAATAGSTNYSTPGSNGLAPSDTYGKLPSGFSFANSGDRAAAGAPSGASSNTAYGTPNYGASSNGYGASNAASSTSAGSSAGYSAGPDPRLTPVQVAAGAWSIDSYGRILDRQGRTMNATSLSSSSAGATSPSAITATNQNTSPSSNYGSGAAYGSNTGYTGSGFTNLGGSGDASSFPNSSILGPPTTQGSFSSTQPAPNANAIDRNQPLTRTVPSDFGAIRPTTESQLGFDQRGALVRPASTTPTGDPPSLNEQRSTSASVAESEDPREVVAPQPLFNGLLLISLVANVYLIFWLKNLRIQFRDLVAAKRMAATAGSQ